MRKIVMLGFLGMLILSACAGNSVTTTTTPLPTLVATNTALVRPTLPPVFTPTPGAIVTATSTPVLIDPLTGVAVEPPINMTLPEGWGFAYDTFIYQELGQLNYIPFALYQGPVTGGTGSILLLWNFPSIAAASDSSTELNMYVDGLRLLRSVVFDPTCNIGTDPERDFNVGGITATGSYYRVVDCPADPNTRGWFAGLVQRNVNFVFYVYADPIEIVEEGIRNELQAILDTLTFEFPN
jgi:hypothetical protein